jgi:hypothetical protein
VTQGRQHIDFSERNRAALQHVDEFQKVYVQNSMPPWYYALLYPDVKPGYGERQLIAGLEVLASRYVH